jgi:hypothetical protein
MRLYPDAMADAYLCRWIVESLAKLLNNLAHRLLKYAPRWQGSTNSVEHVPAVGIVRRARFFAGIDNKSVEGVWL